VETGILILAEIKRQGRTQTEVADRAESLKYIDIFRAYVEAGDVVKVNKMLRVIFPNGVSPFFKKTPAKTGVSKRPSKLVLRNVLEYMGEAIQD